MDEGETGCGRVWTGFFWFRVGTGGRFCELYKKVGLYRVFEFVFTI